MTHKLISPLPAHQRIDLLDVIRGVAVSGILAVNIFVMGTVGGTQERTFPAAWDADWIAWFGQRVLLEDPKRGLFKLLFGAGMLMMLRRSEGADPKWRRSMSGPDVLSHCLPWA